MALACDLRIASDRASIGQTFNRIGLHPDWGGTWIVPRLVGQAKAAELFFLAEMIEAHEAERIGLINRVVPHDDLEDATNDEGKVIMGGVKDRLKSIKDESESDEERDALTRCLELIEAESAAAKAVKAAQAALDAKVLAKYPKLTEAEIKTLVVDDKWFASIRAAIEGEVQRMTQQLASRVKELEKRYAKPLPELEREVGALSAKVEDHLKQMGVV